MKVRSLLDRAGVVKEDRLKVVPACGLMVGMLIVGEEGEQDPDREEQVLDAPTLLHDEAKSVQYKVKRTDGTIETIEVWRWRKYTIKLRAS